MTSTECLPPHLVIPTKPGIGESQSQARGGTCCLRRATITLKTLYVTSSVPIPTIHRSFVGSPWLRQGLRRLRMTHAVEFHRGRFWKIAGGGGRHRDRRWPDPHAHRPHQSAFGPLAGRHCVPRQAHDFLFPISHLDPAECRAFPFALRDRENAAVAVSCQRGLAMAPRFSTFGWVYCLVPPSPSV